MNGVRKSGHMATVCTSCRHLYRNRVLNHWLYSLLADGVFHIHFFQEMEAIWSSQPSMLLARQAVILHLRHNTRYTVTTEFKSMWDEEWALYIEEQRPAFLLLTDAENIPWDVDKEEGLTIEFLFHTLLGHSLEQTLNCVFISGIELTATKLMGFYIQASARQAFHFRKVQFSFFSSFPLQSVRPLLAV